MNESSYTSADAVPYKLFAHTGVMESLSRGVVPLAHLQFVPTNRCNLACSFCSCSERDKQHEMDVADAVDIATKARELGCVSVTVTGGGEPLMHPELGAIVRAFTDRGISAGLVTNGELLDRLDFGEILTWCRVSISDERPVPELALRQAVDRVPMVDWAFSYVLSPAPDIDRLRRAVSFAEAHNFTHVRIVADLLEPDEVPMETAKAAIDSDIVIWQARDQPEPGAARCWVSQLKPQIGADGSVYPCCGVQYAQEDPARDFAFAMGSWVELPFAPFDGSGCVRCYYGAYNRAIEALVTGFEHRDFI